MNTEQILKSKAYYSKIVGIKFTPRTKFFPSRKPVYKKGDIIPGKKHLFRKNEISKCAETDLYESYISYYDYSETVLLTAAEYAKQIGVSYDSENEEFYRKPKIVIEFIKDSESRSFDSDVEALNFLNSLKEKCRKCGNEIL